MLANKNTITITVKGLSDLYDRGTIPRFFQTAKPPAIAWAAREAPKVCDEAVRDYHDQKRAIFERHGDPVKDKRGKTIAIDVRPDEQAAHDKELAELQAQTVDIPCGPVTVAQLINPVLSEVDMLALEEAGFLTD